MLVFTRMDANIVCLVFPLPAVCLSNMFTFKVKVICFFPVDQSDQNDVLSHFVWMCVCASVWGVLCVLW